MHIKTSQTVIETYGKCTVEELNFPKLYEKSNFRLTWFPHCETLRDE